MNPPHPEELDRLLSAALEEDLGGRGDLTSRLLIPEGTPARGAVVARRDGIVSGLEAALRTFELLSGDIVTEPLAKEGAPVKAGQPMARVAGPARALLAGERICLNLLGHLSGVATLTRAFVDRVAGTGAEIMDTRKTLPGLRVLEKAAVRAGGGRNHRRGLYDAVLIKDNHIAVVGSPAQAVRRVRRGLNADARIEVEVEVEIDSVADLEPVIEAGADIVLLDNMPLSHMREAVRRAAGRCLLEASGGITLGSVRSVAETGVDRISVGALTHSAPSLDVALDWGP
ncbi:MAG: carboxylating nicotinate-nucleotide diphosphorylase [Gemmatimonadota bacterium]